MYVSELLPISHGVELRGQILDERLPDSDGRWQSAWEVPAGILRSTSP
jgi:hypothetical protein